MKLINIQNLIHTRKVAISHLIYTNVHQKVKWCVADKVRDIVYPVLNEVIIDIT